MASSYVAIEFRAFGAPSFASKIRDIDAIPATTLIFKRSRALAWYEREHPTREELACRVVIWVQDALDQTEAQAKPGDEDPYRKLALSEVEYQIPRELGVLLESLGAECSIVERGRLRFTTRRYEAPVRDQLVADIERVGGKLARAEFGVERRRLVGRVEGTIEKIHELEQLVGRSGLVDLDEILVDYQ